MTRLMRFVFTKSYGWLYKHNKMIRIEFDKFDIALWHELHDRDLVVLMMRKRVKE